MKEIKTMEQLAQNYRNIANRRLAMIEKRDEKIKELEKRIKELEKENEKLRNSGYIYLEPTFETKA